VDVEIDVEGAELRAISSMEELLLREAAALAAVECMDKTLRRFRGAHEVAALRLVRLKFRGGMDSGIHMKRQ